MWNTKVHLISPLPVWNTTWKWIFWCFFSKFHLELKENGEYIYRDVEGPEPNSPPHSREECNFTCAMMKSFFLSILETEGPLSANEIVWQAFERSFVDPRVCYACCVWDSWHVLVALEKSGKVASTRNAQGEKVFYSVWAWMCVWSVILLNRLIVNKWCVHVCVTLFLVTWYSRVIQKFVQFGTNQLNPFVFQIFCELSHILMNFARTNDTKITPQRHLPTFSINKSAFKHKKTSFWINRHHFKGKKLLGRQMSSSSSSSKLYVLSIF